MSIPVTADRPVAHARPQEAQPDCSWGSTIGKITTLFGATTSILLAYLFLDFVLASVITIVVVMIAGGALIGSGCCNIPALYSPRIYQRPQAPILSYLAPTHHYQPVRQHYTAAAPIYNPSLVGHHPIPGGRGATIPTHVPARPPQCPQHAIPGYRAGARHAVPGIRV
ncbi:MAG TPA: hypothetical protein VLG44_03455 [Chlamydiales bacterium]|nr:hypothetical protein [Chlamydiales bacterium]